MLNEPMPINWHGTLAVKQVVWDLAYSRSMKLREEGRKMDNDKPKYTVKIVEDGWVQTWEAKLNFVPSGIDGLSALGRTKEEALKNLECKLDSYEDSIHDDIQRAKLYFPDDYDCESEEE